MSSTMRLLSLLIRRSPRQSASAIGLCAAGVAIATLVVAEILALEKYPSLTNEYFFSMNFSNLIPISSKHSDNHSKMEKSRSIVSTQAIPIQQNLYS